MLDPAFRPAVLANRAFRALAQATGNAVTVRLAPGTNRRHRLPLHDPDCCRTSHPQAAGNFTYLERIAKFLLWSRGGYRIHFEGPAPLAAKLAAHYRETPTGKFDSNIVGERMFDHPSRWCIRRALPAERHSAASLGRHLDGCRIGFDLGGSDRKVAAVIEGKVVFSDETVWDPYFQPDPQYHYDGIMDSLKKAAAHLPRVDAIGGSAAGVYVNNRVKVASLFRGVPPDVFNQRVRDLFLEVRKAWNNIPLEVVNDGEVTALAGSMSLGLEPHPGHLARHEHRGRLRQRRGQHHFLDQRAGLCAAGLQSPGSHRRMVRRLRLRRAIFLAAMRRAACSRPRASRWTPKLPLPEKLKHVQKLMDQGDDRARKIYQTIGTYLGYAIRALHRLLRPGECADPGPRHLRARRRHHHRRGQGSAESRVPRADRQDRLPHPRRERQAPRPGGRGGQPAEVGVV